METHRIRGLVKSQKELDVEVTGKWVAISPLLVIFWVQFSFGLKGQH